MLRRQAVCVGILNDLLEVMGMERLLMVEELKPINPRLPISDEEVSLLIDEDAKKKYIRTTYGVDTVEGTPVQENVDMSAEDPALEYLLSVGQSNDSFDVLTSLPIEMGENGLYQPLNSIEEFKLEDAEGAEIMYRYELAEDAPALKTRSRSFCQMLMNSNKLYTRKEIDGMRNHMKDSNTDVWAFRGGWYNHNGEHKPSCRHVWKQVIVRKNGN